MASFGGGRSEYERGERSGGERSGGERLGHATYFQPWTFDAKSMEYRSLASVPNSVFETVSYLRLRRVVPFAIARAPVDGATVLIPLSRG